MVEASSGLDCVLVDCEGGQKNQELTSAYGVRGTPVAIFCDPEGKPIERLGAQDPASVAAQMRRVIARVNGQEPPPASSTPPFKDYSPEALRASQAAAKPLLLYFYDQSEASKAAHQALMDPVLKPHWNRLLVAKAPFLKGDPLCVRLKVERAPTIIVLDGSLENPEETPLIRIEGGRSARDLLRELEFGRDGRVAPGGAAPAEPRRLITKEDEALSDDELDRQFIEAQTMIAREWLRQGRKDKAVEVLNDLLKNYSKHKGSLEVRKLLDSISK